MYSKKKIQLIIDILAPILIKELRLEDHEISIEVETDYKHIPFDTGIEEELFGVTVWPNNRLTKVCTIFLFSKPCRGWKCAVDTLFHELLHVRVAPLTNLASNTKTKRSLKQVDELEEEIVHSISNATVKLALSLDKLKNYVL